MRDHPSWLLPLDAPDATLATAGGKGLNLARLARAGFPVPGGFLITTTAYVAFLAANDLDTRIRSVLESLDAADPAALEEASATLRGTFSGSMMPSAMVEAIQDAYVNLGEPAVAVRSSATAEDLPDLSFAGQQDTFLNVLGKGALISAVIDCWSSLWTARAIGYRARNGIPHRDAAVAVAIQKMVQSQASGVLFTANPLNGKRNEAVIDATLGLGEALVAGLVEPDHYVVDTRQGRILSRRTGAKGLVIRGQAGGGTETVTAAEPDQPALPDTQVLALADLGIRVADHYEGEPQDIEWAWAGGQLYLLQARPITSLYPLPPGVPTEPMAALASFGAFQGMLDPITPLGRDMLIHFLGAIAGVIGQPFDPQDQRLIYVAGERLFIDIGGALRHARFRKIIRRVLSAIEPSTGQVVENLLDDPRFAPRPHRLHPRTVLNLLRFILPVLASAAVTLLRPEHSRRQAEQRIDAAIAEFRAHSAAAHTLAGQIAFIDRIFSRDVKEVLPMLLPRLIVAMGSLNLLLRLARQTAEGEGLALEITRGLPHNVTTEMDLNLWRMAQQLQRDPAAQTLFSNAAAADIAAQFQSGTLPPPAQHALAAFLDRYGMRGLAEIDMGRPRWRENPAPVVQAAQSYMQITDPQQAPEAVFARGAEAASAAIDRLAAALRGLPLGWLKAPFARMLARRVRVIAGLRETPKWTIINFLGLIRQGLLAEGENLASQEMIAKGEDIVFLHMEELRALAAGQRQDLKPTVASRQQTYDREMRRRQSPRLMLGDGQAFYEGLGASLEGDGVITGSPVSPGVVEGLVRVVLDPHAADLQAGEIMVCPGTDPSWTPLFLAAGGLVMEVGGMMTHGSVVAREYGIPAVVGVHQATSRLRTGQRIRVNGSTGAIHPLQAASLDQSQSAG